MFAPGVMVSPVDDAPLGIPFVDTIKLDDVPQLERLDSRSKINVVGDEKGLSG
jgi:hypothetical protein